MAPWEWERAKSILKKKLFECRREYIFFALFGNYAVMLCSFLVRNCSKKQSCKVVPLNTIPTHLKYVSIINLVHSVCLVFQWQTNCESVYLQVFIQMTFHGVSQLIPNRGFCAWREGDALTLSSDVNRLIKLTLSHVFCRYPSMPLLQKDAMWCRRFPASQCLIQRWQIRWICP